MCIRRKNMDIYKGFECHPTVCAVGSEYQIIVPVKFNMLFSVRVGNKEYFNHSNGIKISTTKIQRVKVPMAELDREKKYTVICRKMIKRLPYRSKTAVNAVEIEYDFKPIEKTEDIKIYQIADAHGHIEATTQAARNYADDIDLLILNGDIANASDTFEHVITCYKIASNLTAGTVPCIISRGNHDLRGKYAEVLVDHMPNRNGNSYYTFRVGCIWGILVDCGEDKVDEHEEYGRTICCHQYRQDVTEYIKEVIKSEEYKAEGIKYRLVLSHVPFQYKFWDPFGIESDIYTEWCRLLRVNIKPDLLIAGHTHAKYISLSGGKYDTYGQPCPVIVGSDVKNNKDRSLKEYYGVGIKLKKDFADVEFTSNLGNKEGHKVKYGMENKAKKERIIYKHVAVIGLDGMGNFNRESNTPNLDSIFANGATTYYGLSMDPTISAENWGAMLLGANPLVHGLTNSIVGSREYTNKALPSVFTRIREKHPDAVLTSICNWNPINHGIVEHDVNVKMDTGDNDTVICEKVVEAVREKPEFLFVQFDEPDGAGHHYGYGTDEQHDTIEKIDSYVGRIYREYASEGILDDTLFIALADHGGRIHSHGGYSDTEKYVFIGVSGKGIEKSEIEFMQTVDIASVVLYALGLEYPEYDIKSFSSQIPKGIFPWYDGKYNRAEPHPSNPLHKPTPDFKGENGLTKFFDEDKIKLACFFDNSMKDETGKCTLNETGICKYYSDGIRGERTELGATGYVTVYGLSFGKNSFTLSMWIKIDRSLVWEPCLVGNKAWNHGERKEPGFTICLRRSNTIFNIGCDGDDTDITTPFSSEISEGWVHSIFAVDKENKQIRIYYDFDLLHTVELEPQYDINLDNLTFAIGNDATGAAEGTKLEEIFNIDDLFIFDGAFGDAEVEKLKKYYE